MSIIYQIAWLFLPLTLTLPQTTPQKTPAKEYLIATISSTLPEYPSPDQQRQSSPNQNQAQQSGTPPSRKISQVCLAGNSLTKQLFFRQGETGLPDVRFLGSYYEAVRESCDRKIEYRSGSDWYFMMIYYLSAYDNIQNNFQQQADNLITYYHSPKSTIQQVITHQGFKIKSTPCITHYRIEYTPPVSRSTTLYIVLRNETRQYPAVVEKISVDVRVEGWDLGLRVEGAGGGGGDAGGRGSGKNQLYYVDVYRVVGDQGEFGRCCGGYGLEADLVHIQCVKKIGYSSYNPTTPNQQPIPDPQTSNNNNMHNKNINTIASNLIQTTINNTQNKQVLQGKNNSLSFKNITGFVQQSKNGSAAIGNRSVSFDSIKDSNGTGNNSNGNLHHNYGSVISNNTKNISNQNNNSITPDQTDNTSHTRQIIIGISIASLILLLTLTILLIRFYKSRQNTAAPLPSPQSDLPSSRMPNTVQYQYQPQPQSQQQQQQEVAKQHRPQTVLRAKQRDCSICLDSRCNALLPCGHYFHYRCILDWLVKKRRCPLCRRRTKVSDLRIVNVEVSTFINYRETNSNEDNNIMQDNNPNNDIISISNQSYGNNVDNVNQSGSMNPEEVSYQNISNFYANSGRNINIAMHGNQNMIRNILPSNHNHSQLFQILPNPNPNPSLHPSRMPLPPRPIFHHPQNSQPQPHHYQPQYQHQHQYQHQYQPNTHINTYRMDINGSYNHNQNGLYPNNEYVNLSENLGRNFGRGVFGG